MKTVSLIIIFCLIFLSFSGCAPNPSLKRNTYEPGGMIDTGYCALGGAVAGVTAGALTRLKKPAENAFIGAIAGAISGVILCRIIEIYAQRAALEAIEKDRRVEIKTQQGQRVTAEPAYRKQAENCREIVNEAWDSDGTYLGKITRYYCRDASGQWKEVWYKKM